MKWAPLMRASTRTGLLTVALGVIGATSAAAQAPVRPDDVGMTLPETAAGQARSDHDQVLGRWAVGYLGFRSLSIGQTPEGEVDDDVDVPVVGVRYWVSELVGIDAGLGLLLETAEVTRENEAGGTTTDPGARTALVLHGGVPLALAASGHFTFELIPEFNLGFVDQTVEAAGAAPDLQNSGFHFDLGARAGAEIHCGFIGIPQLSLQGSVGVSYTVEHTSSEVDGSSERYETRRGALATTLQDDPWDVFQGGVSAFYYF